MTRSLLRSPLFMPASNAKALAKAPSLECDAVVVDLEDAVHPDAREDAREQMRVSARDWMSRPRLLAVRINPLSTEWGTEDLIAALAIRPDAIILPKTEAPQDVVTLAEAFNEFDLSPAPQIWAMIETARGILNAPAIAELGQHKSARLSAFLVGPNDLAKQTGVRDPAEMAPWLMQILLAARAGGLLALDGVHNDFRDTGAFEAACHAARRRGFDGKMLIHPSQIGPANQIFSPDASDIAEARAIVEAFSRRENEGKGVINVNDRMVERLHLEQALAILAQRGHS
jgi:citrate lyase subunit beta / citryl-CoA lyase